MSETYVICAVLVVVAAAIIFAAYHSTKGTKRRVHRTVSPSRARVNARPYGKSYPNL